MSDALETMRTLIQEDPGHRGLRTDPVENLVTVCAADFRTACRSLAETAQPVVGVVTGFFIPQAEPPAGETDGPLGALFLARALVPLGVKLILLTDDFCVPALAAGLEACGLGKDVLLLSLAIPEQPAGPGKVCSWPWFSQLSTLTHLLALERVGPSHTPDSLHAQRGCTAEATSRFLHEVPPEQHGRCHTMKGRDITAQTSPAHLLFEASPRFASGLTTIGIGDGGNEIGMGKIPWEVIRRNIPGGGLVACRVPTDYLIVCGVSNWGAYGLAAGVRWLRGVAPDRALFDPERERELLQLMVEQGPLVDGVLGKPSVSVDGLSFERYAEPLRRLAESV